VNKKQIAVIFPGQFPGKSGDTSNYSEILNQLVAEGFQVLLICPKVNTSDDKIIGISKEVEVIRVPYLPPRLKEIGDGLKLKHYLQFLVFLLVEGFVVFRTLGRKKIKYAFVRHEPLTIQLPLIFKILKVKTIADGAFVSDLLKDQINSKILMLLRRYEKKIIRCYTYFWVPTNSHAEIMLRSGFPKERILVIPVSINTSKIPKFPLDKIPEHTFGYFGVIEKWQGVDILVNAFELLLKRIPNAILYILGEGSLKHKVKEDVIRKNLSGSVIFDSVSREVLLNDYLKKFQIVVIPRPKQGDAVDGLVPIKLIESLAAGKPTIVMDIPSMREISNNAIVVVHSSEPESLAMEMENLSLDANKMKAYAEAASDISQHYDIERNMKKIINTLTSID